MSTKARQRNRTKKPTTRTKTTPQQPAAAPKLPTLDVRNRRPFITDIQIRAAYTAALAGVTYTRITGWQHQTDGTVRYAMPSGAGLTYNPTAKTPLTAWTPCAHGTRHPHPVTTPRDLHDAQHDAASCTGHTAQADERPLADQLTRPDPSNDDTQQTDITALLADHDTPQEHPHD